MEPRVNYLYEALHVVINSNIPSRAQLIAEFNELPDDARISERHVAAVRYCSTATLQRDRVYGGGIPFIREGGTIKTDKNGLTRIFGGRVFYLKRDVVAFLEARNRTVMSTSELSGDAA
jgi:hypothetical protein